MAAVTLAQAAQLEKQPLKKGIMSGLTQESVISDIMSWRTIGGLSEAGVRYDEVITPDWIALGGAISSKSANGKPLNYSIYEMSLHIDVPTMLENQVADMLERQSVRQTMLAIRGAAYTMNDMFINGDQGVTANQPEGVNKAVASMGSAQTIGSTEIDISATATSTNNMLAVERLMDATDYIEGHGGGSMVAGFCNSSFARQFRKIILREQLLGNDHNWIADTFAINDPRVTQRTKATKPAFVFNHIPFYNIGVKADQTTEIIGNTYTEGGSTAAGTRVFICRFGDEDIEGIQGGPLDVTNIGPLEATNNIRKRMTWRPGLAIWGPRSIVKVQGIKVA